jgi:ATP-dependent DNA helicase RecG
MQDERVKRIIKFCKTPKNREEIQFFLKINDRKYFRKEILNPLIEKGLLIPTIPDKPTSPNQQYYSYKSEKNA